VSSQPVVSVIIPVWNVEPYLRQCLDSVVEQTIGLEQLEVIAVNDGSTDGSGRLLDEYASQYPQLKVISEPNSGGPGRPRNVGLDRSTGRYVFFLDADDYLGSECLERLVAMADHNASDVVLGKMVGVDGRRVPTQAFRRNLNQADLKQVYSTLGVLKLFRRSLIEHLGLRFAEGVPGGEDGAFTERVYLEAKVISVVADYDCYYNRQRLGSQTLSTSRQDDVVDYLTRRSERIELLTSHRGPSAERDQLMTRHIWDLVRAFNQRWLALEPAERGRVFDAAVPLLKRWNTDSIQAQLSPPLALRAYCLEHGLRSELEDIVACSSGTAYGNSIVDGARVFAGFPHFRDESGIPESCFEITNQIKIRRRATRAELEGTTLHLAGEAYLTHFGGDITIILRRWPRGPEYRFPARPISTPHLRDRYRAYPHAGFATAIDFASAADGRPMRRGAWQILLSVGSGPVRRTVGFKPSQDIRAAIEADHDNEVATALYLTPQGNLRVRVDAPGLITTLEQIGYRLWRLRRRLLRLVSSLVRRARRRIFRLRSFISRPGRG
jgi:poly(ribitol-phosphate) beta-N-acetylglucosaminyltransferase